MTVQKNNKKYVFLAFMAFLLCKNIYCQNNIDSANVYALNFGSSYRIRITLDLITEEVEKILLPKKESLILYSELKQMKDSLCHYSKRKPEMSRYNIDCRLRIDFYTRNQMEQFGFGPNGLCFFNDEIYSYDLKALRKILDNVPAIKELVHIK